MNSTPPSVEALLDVHAFNAALREVEEGWTSSAESFVLRARALGGLGRFDEAITELEKVVAATNLSPLVRADALVRAQGYRARVSNDTTAMLRDLGRALEMIGEGGIGNDWTPAKERAPEVASVAGRAHLESATLFARKRAKKLADEALERARTTIGETADLHARTAAVALHFDGRLEARAAYEKVRAAGGEHVAHLGLARVALLLGDFAACHALIDDFAWGDDELDHRQLQVDVLGAEQRWGDVAGVLGEMIAVSPYADARLSYELDRALALYRAGERGTCETALAALIANARDGRDGRVAEARRSLALLRRTDGPHASARLKAFPTVAQLRNHCGPASCELYLRFLGLEAKQDVIGKEIMFAGSGTSFLRMRGMLERAGLHVLRIEAELPRLRTLIDLGIPVILEETYSQSGHAAVAIGYDDLREVLVVQDPMTHAVRYTPYGELAEIQDMANAGGLIAIAPGDSARLAALERAQISECRYMVLIDKAFEALEAGDLDTAERLSGQSIEIRRDYELAWWCRFSVAMRRLDKEPTAEHRLAAHLIVNEAIAIWPDDDWTRALAGRLALSEDRVDEALAAFERACDADRWDPGNWFGLAQCAFRQRDYGRVHYATGRALELNPSHQDATELGAYASLLTGDVGTAAVLNDCALAVAPDNSFNHLVRGDILAARSDYSGALASYHRAIELDADRAAQTYWKRAEFLRKLGRFTDLSALFLAGPPDVEPSVLLAHRAQALLDGQQPAEAAQAARDLEAMDGKAALGAAMLSTAHLDLGQSSEADAAAERTLAIDITYGRAQATKGILAASRDDERGALLHLGLALALNPGDAERSFHFASALEKFGHVEEVPRHFDTAIRGGGLGEERLLQAAGGLGRARSFRAALDLLDEIAGNPERRREALRVKARVLTEMLWAPGAAAEASRALANLDADDAFALTTAGAERFDGSIEGEGPGEALLRQGREKLGEDHPYPRRLLARRLIGRGRAQEALVLLPEPDVSDYQDTDLRVDALTFLERFDDAEQVVAAFERRMAGEGEEPRPIAPLRFTVAEARGDFETALALAKAAGQDAGEDAGDAHLDDWELSQFRCLMSLGRVDEAVNFGSLQGGDSGSLGRLAHQALLAGSLDAARPLAELALRLDPAEAYAIHVLGREAELRGDAAAAREYYEKTGAVDPGWHAWLEELARLAIAEGRFQDALVHADKAVAEGGHTCSFAVAVRAQARLVNGDLDGARADALRAWGLGSASDRDRVSLDVWGLCRQLRGEVERGSALWDRFLGDPRAAGPLDRARIGHLREALARGGAR
jgi:tetratricopeptide (TPR) repeat protein